MSALLKDAKAYIADQSEFVQYGDPALCQDFSGHQPPPASGIFDVSFVYR